MKAVFAHPAVLATFLGFTINSFGVVSPEGGALPNFDKRPGATGSPATPKPEQNAAARVLGNSLAGAQVDFDRITGGPKLISAREKFLTGINGAGVTVSAATAANYAGDPYGPTKGFLAEHADLFGFGPEGLEGAVIAREFVTPHNGLKTVVWQQQLNGIPIAEGLLISHTTKDQELVNVSSQFVANPAGAADQGLANWRVKLASPDITAGKAAAVAVRTVGQSTQNGAPEPAQAQTPPSDADPQQTQQLIGTGIQGTAQAKLVWLAVDPDRIRLCWEIIFTSRARGEMFRVIVDAQNGEPWLRHCLTDYLSPASYRVFTSDSPSPFSPGYATPVTNQPPLVARTLVTIDALNTNASPNGWIEDGGNETRGNNVDAHTDLNADNLPDLPRPQGSPFRVFDFSMDLTTQDPTNYASASVVQLFYLCNWMHDKLYQLGFTEAAGNFQSNNFGRGGIGNDAVQADALDGSGFNNANFSTPPDGSAGRMQMYIFTNPNPRRDGDLDAEVVLHEYTHGLSNRRVGGGVGISALQSQGMGEGWSDFYAITLLSEAGDDVNGNYAAGAYASYKIGGASDLQNYYFGIRRYPYSTDLNRNPLTFKDIDPAQAAYCSSPAPYHTGMFGSCSTAGANEVHNQGELWCVTLWEARARLVNKYGRAVGNQLILQLVTDGMNLSPANPTFLQARDGILQADQVDNGGANLQDLWVAFAKRGMGFSATSPSSSTTTGVHESFDIPDDLRITPSSGFVSRGPVGGPFTPTAQTFVVTNVGSNVLSWTLVNTSSWLNFSAVSGTLNPGGASTGVTGTVSAVASTLPAGVYGANALFSNSTSHASQSRQFSLRVGQPDYFTELFDASTNDLAFQSWTFTPDSSASAYSVCRQIASSFPTDPTGGTTVALTDDSYAAVTLSGGNTVAIYNKRTNMFFIGSNGYLTMNSGDSQYIESYANHFGLPRVSGVFHDMNPGNGGKISWRQLVDRVAVSYQAIPEYANNSRSNSFQVELFFDGRIRLTYLDIRTVSGLAGLSAGLGTPANFEKSDLTSYGPCAPLTLILPGQATEGAGTLPNAGTLLLSSALPTNLVVALTSSAPSRLVVPASTTINAGQLLSTFDLNVPDNGVQDGNQVVTVGASAPGLTNTTSTMLIVDDDTPPVIVTQPASTTAPAGATASFSVSATGKSPLSYSWSRNGSPIAGATASAYSTNNVQVSDSGSQFSCLVTNPFGSVQSSNAVLTVVTGAVDLVNFDDLATDPSPIPVPSGYHGLNLWSNFYALDSLNYPNSGYSAGMVSSPNVAYNGNGTPASLSNSIPFNLFSGYLTAAWNDNLQVEVKGYVGASLTYDNTYTLSATAPTLINFGYANVSRVDFISSGGTQHPGYAGIGTQFVMDDVLIGLPPARPVVLAQPVSQLTTVGGSATFNLSAAGSAPLNYSWRRNGVPIAGATTSSYTVNNAQLTDAGSRFSCLVSNSYGSIVSSNALLGIAGTLHAFSGPDGGYPHAALAQGPDGNLYGATAYGGPAGSGTVFRLNTNGQLATVFSFDSFNFYANGYNPNGGLVSAPDSNLYGTTSSGGTEGSGTIFRLNTNGTLTTIASLSYTNGSYTSASMAVGPEGALYGTAPNGGAFGAGSIFKVTTNGVLKTLVSFNTTNGSFPYGTLALGPDGNFYGTCSSGGSNDYGTVFRVTTNGTLTTLVSLDYQTSGAYPYAGLVLGTDGNFYGTTSYGGSNAYWGGVFRVTTNGAFTSVASFYNTNGANPFGGLVLVSDGSFYGTTTGGGTYFDGTVYRVTTNGLLTSLFSFAGTNGTYSESSLMLGSDGSFYGTTSFGGVGYSGNGPYLSAQGYDGNQTTGDGTIFRLAFSSNSTPPFIIAQPLAVTVPASGSATFSLNAGGAAPLSFSWRRNGGLIAGATASTYTTNNAQISGSGSQLSCLVSNSLGSVLSSNVSLTVLGPSNSGPILAFHGFDGGESSAGLVQAADGNFYGTTTYGGYGYGTVFRLSPNGGLSILQNFNYANGAYPYSGLIQGTDRNLYGTAFAGGGSGYGTVFRITTNGALTTLLSFDYSSNGANPRAGVSQGSDGNLYGTTTYGGPAGYGTVFKLTTNGAITTLLPFGYTNGAYPYAALAQGRDGSFYGSTIGGSSNGYGNAFRITSNGVFTALAVFDSTNGGPWGALALGPDGNFYGTFPGGGAFFAGSIFRMTTNGAVSIVASLDFSSGAYPYAGLILGNDNALYGTTTYGGTNNGFGAVFRATTAGALISLFSFGATNGASPQAPVVQAADGNLYGTTQFGAAGNDGYYSSGNGVVFRINLPPTAPAITVQPTNQVVMVGTPAVFTIEAAGTLPLNYFWRRNGSPIAGATSSSYTNNSSQLIDSGTLFSCLVSNIGGSVLSSNASLTVLAVSNDFCSGAFVISGFHYTNMQSTVAATSSGDPVPFCGSGFGNGVWYSFTPGANGKMVIDTIGSDFDTILTVYSGSCGGALTAVACDDDGGGGFTSRTSAQLSAGTTYFIVAGGYGSTSGNLVLHFDFAPSGSAPIIVSQPVSQTKSYGEPVVFTVTASGSLPLVYQWRFNSLNVGVSSSALAFSMGVLNVGTYQVEVANSSGSVTSAPATLAITGAASMGALRVPGDFRILFNSSNGHNYILEYKNALSNDNWTPLRTNVGDGSIETISNLLSTNPQRYFRLRVQ